MWRNVFQQPPLNFVMLKSIATLSHTLSVWQVPPISTTELGSYWWYHRLIHDPGHVLLECFFTWFYILCVGMSKEGGAWFAARMMTPIFANGWVRICRLGVRDIESDDGMEEKRRWSMTILIIFGIYHFRRVGKNKEGRDIISHIPYPSNGNNLCQETSIFRK